MTVVPTFTFDRAVWPAFHAQSAGTDPYTPGRRSRRLLSEILGWGLDTEAVKVAVRDQGVALLTNLPFDIDLPETPQDGKRPQDKRTFVSEGLLNAVSCALGLHPVAFHTEKDGDLIHQIVPLPGKETSTSNMGAYRFNFHTEGTNLPFPPDVIALLCLRNTEYGATDFVHLPTLLKDAPAAVIHALRQPWFNLTMGHSHGSLTTYTLPIIRGDDGPTALYRADLCDIEAINDDALSALDWLRFHAGLASYQVALQPGQMLLVNNWQCLHGRVGFTPDYSERKQRWLQRQYMTANPHAGVPADGEWGEMYPHIWDGR